MYLKLNHQNLDVCKVSRKFVAECYKLSNQLPTEEKFGMISQIRRAALSVYLKISEVTSRKSEKEKKQYCEISRSSLIKIDAAMDVANDLDYLKNTNSAILGDGIISCLKMLTDLINSRQGENK